DTRLVNHLDTDADEALTLDDLVRVAVDRREHRVRKAARDEAIVEAQALVTVVDAVSEAAAGRPARRNALPRLRCDFRNLAVRWIRYEPRTARLLDLEDVP